MRNSTLCYIEQDGYYLMLHRIKKEHDVNRDKWIGVGGGFEEGESPEDCVLREVLEETGLTLHGPRFQGIVTFLYSDGEGEPVTEYMFLFTATDFSGSIPTGDACDEGILEWVPKEQVPDLPIWEGDRIFLRLLAEDAPCFSLKLRYEGDILAEAVLNGMPLTL